MSPFGKLATKFLCTFLCIISILLLTSCSLSGPIKRVHNKPVKAPEGQQNFRSPIIDTDISTFDPAQATDMNSVTAIDMVFTGLVQENDHLQVQPQLAQSYEASQDGLTWTFHLRPHLTFSDGSLLTAQDVVYSIDRALSPQISALNGVSLTYLGLIKGASERMSGTLSTIIGSGVIAQDANTVVINVTNRTAYFLQALTYPTSYVVEKKVIDQWGLKWTDHLSDNKGQGGSGPFKVQSYSHGTGIVFVSNPDYYGKQPQLKQVAFPFIKDTATSYLEYQSDQVDETLIPTADFPKSSVLTDQFRHVPQLWIFYYGLNYLVKPLDNTKIRQALDLAINKDVIAQSIWGGQYLPTNHIVPEGMMGYDPALTGPAGSGTKGNPTLARQLFNEGLHEEGLTLSTFPTIKFTYSNASIDTSSEVTTVIQMWQQVLGITSIKPDPIDSTRLISAISNTSNNASLQIWKVDWIADYPDPQDWITTQFSANSPENNMNYGQNHSTEALQQQSLQIDMALADQIINSTNRLSAYNQIEQQLLDDVAWLPMQQVMLNYLLKPYVIGVVDNAQSLVPPDDWGNIYIAAH